MFLGREKELARLENAWQKFDNPVISLYGRRRIGKTTLLKKFMNGKNALYLQAQTASYKENLIQFNEDIRKSPFADRLPDTSDRYRFWRNIFDLSRKEKLLLILDEFPFLNESGVNFTGELRALVENYEVYDLNARLMIVICGSSLSFMTENVDGYKDPFYGRLTDKISLQPFSFSEMRPMLTGFSFHDACLLYGITGGVPKYVEKIETGLSVEENLEKMLFAQPAVFDPPEFFLSHERVNRELAWKIVDAVAKKKRKEAKILDYVKGDRAEAKDMLLRLCDMEILENRAPFSMLGRGVEGSGQNLFYVNDYAIMFWHKLLFPMMRYVRDRNTDVIRDIMDRMPDHMGSVFESICSDWTYRNKYPIGAMPENWWGKIGDIDMEIDMIGQDFAGNRAVLFGECKWENRETGADVLASLIRKSDLLVSENGHMKNRQFAIFSKMPFTNGCRELAESCGYKVNLFTLDDMDDFPKLATARKPAGKKNAALRM